MKNILTTYRTSRFHAIAGRIVALALLAIFFASALPVPASAITPQQRRLYDNDIRYYDIAEDELCAAGATGATAANLTVGKDFSLGTDPLGRRVNLMKALVADLGLTPEQASGILGNFMREAGAGIPANINQGGTLGPPNGGDQGYGWAQWSNSTVTHTGRKTTFLEFYKANGYAAADGSATDAANYAYLKDELSKGYANALTALKATNTPDAAAASFEDTYESAGIVALGERQTLAKQALAEYNGGGAVTPATGSTAAGTAAAAAAGCPGTSGANGATIVGNTAFPLKTTKAGVLNRNIFANGTTNKAGHPYTAFDILANPGTEVVAFLSGTVTLITEDKCPGRMISIYNAESDTVVSYLHMNTSAATHIAMGAVVKAGDHVGQVGPPAAGCGTPHLHIDAAKGKVRPGCARENCPAANAAQFVDIGPQLFTTYQALQP